MDASRLFGGRASFRPLGGKTAQCGRREERGELGGSPRSQKDAERAQTLIGLDCMLQVEQKPLDVWQHGMARARSCGDAVSGAGHGTASAVEHLANARIKVGWHLSAGLPQVRLRQSSECHEPGGAES